MTRLCLKPSNACQPWSVLLPARLMPRLVPPATDSPFPVVQYQILVTPKNALTFDEFTGTVYCIHIDLRRLVGLSTRQLYFNIVKRRTSTRYTVISVEVELHDAIFSYCMRYERYERAGSPQNSYLNVLVIAIHQCRCHTTYSSAVWTKQHPWTDYRSNRNGRKNQITVILFALASFIRDSVPPC